MANSSVDICNIALKLLGQQSITSLEEGTDRAALAATLYDSTRDEVLRAHPWNCASARAVLAQDVTPPPFGYAYSYTLPGEPTYCLKVNLTAPKDAEWQIEGRKLLTDESAIGILYTYRLTDVAQYDSYLVKALAAKLAYEMAYPLTRQVAVMDRMERRYQGALDHAATADSQEGTAPTLDNNILRDARIMGARFPVPNADGDLNP